jgi:hypothetical protein
MDNMSDKINLEDIRSAADYVQLYRRFAEKDIGSIKKHGETLKIAILPGFTRPPDS